MTSETSLHRRLLLAASGAVIIVTLTAGLLAAFAIRSVGERAFEARLRQTAASILAGLARDASGTLSLEDGIAEQPEFARPRSGWYWQAEQNGAVVLRSRSLGIDALPVGASTAVGSAMVHGQPVLTASAAQSSQDGLRVTVAGPRTALDRSISEELGAVLGLLVGLCLVLLLALDLAIRRALAPLDRLIKGIQALRAGSREHLPTERIREIDEAASAINGLVGETRTLVAANRDAAAKLAHALKTPLARVSALAGQADGATGRDIEAAVAAIRRQIDQNLARLRRAHTDMAGRTVWTRVRPILEELVFAFSRRDAARGISAEITCDEAVEVPVERTDLEELLGNILDNAFRHARSKVTITAGEPLSITIADDGSGFPKHLLRRLMRDDAEADDADTAGLGLPLAREIVVSTGGRIEIANVQAGGGLVRLTWPNRQPDAA